VLTYATQILKLPQALVLNFVMIQALVSLATIPLFGHVSDLVGRRRVTAIGCAAMMVFPFIYFRLLDTRQLPLVFGAIVLGLPVQDLQYGPQAALIAESFPSRLRYSGSSLGYQLASVTAGGPAPLVALWLFERFHSSDAVAVYVALSAVVSLIALWLLPDRSHGELDAD
jgi:MFS family permease